MTNKERIAELEKKKQQIIARQKALIARESEAERKARTKRLIEIGAGVESVLKQDIGKDKLVLFLDYLRDQENRGQWVTKAIKFTPTVEADTDANSAVTPSYY